MIDSRIRFALAAGICVLLSACATSKLAPPPSSERVSLPPPPPVGEPTGIAGLEASQLRVAFGAPVFVRKDGAAEMWRYDGARCKAFFFLYSDGASLAVRHVETLPRGSEMAADAGCLNALRARGSGATS